MTAREMAAGAIDQRGSEDPARTRQDQARVETICVDLDSTIADTRHRHHMVLREGEREHTDWVAYSLACAADAPIPGTSRLVHLLFPHYRIVLVSSRDEVARSLTERWLEDQSIPYDELILGGVDGVPRGLEEFKIHHVRSLLDRGERVVLMIDDMPTLPQAMMDAVGIPTLSIRPPY